MERVLSAQKFVLKEMTELKQIYTIIIFLVLEAVVVGSSWRFALCVSAD